MRSRGPLVAVAAAQLAAGVAGLAVALLRRRAYDIWLPRGVHVPLSAGAPEHVVRDALWMGTAYSAPVPMLLAQGWALGRLAAGSDPRAVRVLTTLGGFMVPGFLSERHVRAHLQHWDPAETPVVVAGIGLAAAMVVLGVRGSAAENRGSGGHERDRPRRA